MAIQNICNIFKNTEFKCIKKLLEINQISKEIYDKHPDYQKCFMGLIHSHHGMGAYFSGTDKQQLEEAANKVGYPSLVVAHTKTKFAFGISYLDNFNQVQL